MAQLCELCEPRRAATHLDFDSCEATKICNSFPYSARPLYILIFRPILLVIGVKTQVTKKFEARRGEYRIQLHRRIVGPVSDLEACQFEFSMDENIAEPVDQRMKFDMR